MYAEQVLMLSEGNPVAIGTPSQIFTPQQLEAVYDVVFEVMQLFERTTDCRAAFLRFRAPNRRIERCSKTVLLKV